MYSGLTSKKWYDIVEVHTEIRSVNNSLIDVNVHTFGDSHSKWGISIFDDTTINIRLATSHLGARLMHSFGRDGLRLLNISESDKVKPNDVVVFSFGEIDCRCHIHKFSSKNGVIAIIDSLVSGYETSILDNINLLPGTVFVWVAGIVPPVSGAAIYGDNPFPFIGSLNDRLLYVILVNQRIEEIERVFIY
jgi:hypothetical protein